MMKNNDREIIYHFNRRKYRNHKRKRSRVLKTGICLFCLFLGSLTAGCSGEKTLWESSQTVEEEETEMSVAGERMALLPEETEAAASVFVDVGGAVVHPGVYELSKGARIYEAVTAAGGLAPDAATRDLNLAAFVTDGQKIWVSTKEEEAILPVEQSNVQTADGAVQGGSASGLLDLNRATKEELMTLPGIGEAKAEAILSYRENNGPFAETADIMKISGIKNAVFDQIKDRVTVS